MAIVFQCVHKCILSALTSLYFFEGFFLICVMISYWLYVYRHLFYVFCFLLRWEIVKEWEKFGRDMKCVIAYPITIICFVINSSNIVHYFSNMFTILFYQYRSLVTFLIFKASMTVEFVRQFITNVVLCPISFWRKKPQWI